MLGPAQLRQMEQGDFSLLGVTLDALPDDGHLHLAGQDSDLQKAPWLGIARTWLWLLGYLKRDTQKQQADSDFIQGLMRFQQEVGLTADGVLDNLSWQALKSLAAFDSDTQVETWDPANPAFRRAVQLRLFSYGLCKTAPPFAELPSDQDTKLQKRLHQALEDFTRLVAWYALSAEPLDSGWNRPLLRLLFAHQELIALLPFDGEGFRLSGGHPLLPMAAPQAKALRRRFVGNLALVELWLMGYPVRPGNFKADGPHDGHAKGTLYWALKQFAKDRQLPIANTHAIQLGAWFFHKSRQILSDDPPLPAEQLDAVMADSHQRHKLETGYKSLGARIVDGVKRLLRWFGALLRQVLDRAKQWFINLARLLHKGASEIYAEFKALIEISARGWHYWQDNPLQLSDRQSLMIFKQRDFDLDLIFNPLPNSTQIACLFNTMQLNIQSMALGGQVLVQLIALIRQIMSLANMLINWLGVVVALYRLGLWLRANLPLLAEAGELQAAFKQLDGQTK
ncbi:peptidoglycan-binding protein [Bowmanella denitrificans]|uniref:peptidoglycan-binding protein n=1 Tax=Bowmanella denitrificans TaxID=366582 RepID=UPI000C9D16D3|nr:peptidoglycan-binding protein [Bowmanella denitrificans]